MKEVLLGSLMRSSVELRALVKQFAADTADAVLEWMEAVRERVGADPDYFAGVLGEVPRWSVRGRAFNDALAACAAFAEQYDQICNDAGHMIRDKYPPDADVELTFPAATTTFHHCLSHCARIRLRRHLTQYHAACESAIVSLMQGMKPDVEVIAAQSTGTVVADEEADQDAAGDESDADPARLNGAADTVDLGAGWG